MRRLYSVEGVEQGLRGNGFVDYKPQITAHDRETGYRFAGRHRQRAQNVRGQFEHDGSLGQSEMPDEARVQFAQPSRRYAVDGDRRRTSRVKRRMVRGRGRDAPGRCERLEITLDVIEVDVTCRQAPLFRRRPAIGQAAKPVGCTYPAAAWWNVRPSSKMRIRDSLRLRFVCSVSIKPGSSDVRMTSRWLAMGFSTRTGWLWGVMTGEMAASMAESTKLNVTISCQSRFGERMFHRARRAPCFGIRQHVLHVRGRLGGDRVVTVDARDFLDEVLLDAEVEPEGRGCHGEIGAFARERKT